jgi:excisionase family DNA binding protein
MTRNESHEQLLTAKEVAGLLRVAPSTIYSAAARGDLPCLRPWRGRRKSLLRFRSADIEALIAGRKPVDRESELPSPRKVSSAG